MLDAHYSFDFRRDFGQKQPKTAALFFFCVQNLCGD
jgi:hypothetical protein